MWIERFDTAGNEIELETNSNYSAINGGRTKNTGLYTEKGSPAPRLNQLNYDRIRHSDVNVQLSCPGFSMDEVEPALIRLSTQNYESKVHLSCVNAENYETMQIIQIVLYAVQKILTKANLQIVKEIMNLHKWY